MPEPHELEQTFFPDPSVDRVLGVVMALAAEVFVLRRQVRALRGETEEGSGDADAFVARLLATTLGEREAG